MSFSLPAPLKQQLGLYRDSLNAQIDAWAAEYNVNPAAIRRYLGFSREFGRQPNSWNQYQRYLAEQKRRSANGQPNALGALESMGNDSPTSQAQRIRDELAPLYQKMKEDPEFLDRTQQEISAWERGNKLEKSSAVTRAEYKRAVRRFEQFSQQCSQNLGAESFTIIAHPNIGSNHVQIAASPAGLHAFQTALGTGKLLETFQNRYAACICLTIASTDDATGLGREHHLDVQVPLQPQDPIILPEDPTLLTSIQKRKLATPLFQRLVESGLDPVGLANFRKKSQSRFPWKGLMTWLHENGYRFNYWPNDSTLYGIRQATGDATLFPAHLRCEGLNTPNCWKSDAMNAILRACVDPTDPLRVVRL
ncbi:hypothetical protein MVES1_002045 [Malassezia vespertilionis]|uniref:Uncharacterized protein n=1 Tax=Malassezia vespertilionis TaxID=2020962 RepID=A0A2N1JBU4_9BASI|nr:uncharacterized protein MVES1_002045 [Malassezia vespertilionis]PKI84024.1 hypothetical protein MVES_001935 [Malassezia vespertilionis]WFD06691.1 hypothetical protein MVES1_002045 [Malassezia vespertilionis]